MDLEYMVIWNDIIKFLLSGGVDLEFVLLYVVCENDVKCVDILLKYYEFLLV